MEEKFQCELKCRRRGPKESLRELAQDIQRLMTLAYPGERSRMADHIARDAFLAALDDQDLHLKICEREPADLEAALQIAQRFEILRERLKRQLALDTGSAGRHMYPRIRMIVRNCMRT